MVCGEDSHDEEEEDVAVGLEKSASPCSGESVTSDDTLDDKASRDFACDCNGVQTSRTDEAGVISGSARRIRSMLTSRQC